MSTDERLALVVEAEAARIRSEQAQERAKLLERRTAPFFQALERFEEQHRRPPEVDDGRDFATVWGYVSQLGGDDLTWDDFTAASAAIDEASALASRATAAREALEAAGMPRDIPSPLAWAGATAEEFDRAVKLALSASEA